MANPNQEPVTVRVPVRIDFAGGWSDVDYFASSEGGAVLNAAIDQYVEGSARWEGWQLRLEYALALPEHSHLGTSGAINVAWLALTNGLIGRERSPVELAEAGYKLENIFGVEGGKQDLYAAALGGFNLLRFQGGQVITLHQRILSPRRRERQVLKIIHYFPLRLSGLCESFIP